MEVKRTHGNLFKFLNFLSEYLSAVYSVLTTLYREQAMPNVTKMQPKVIVYYPTRPCDMIAYYAS